MAGVIVGIRFWICWEVRFEKGCKLRAEENRLHQDVAGGKIRATAPILRGVGGRFTKLAVRGVRTAAAAGMRVLNNTDLGKPEGDKPVEGRVKWRLRERKSGLPRK